MTSPLYLATQIGFAVAAIFSYWVLFAELKKALMKTQFDEFQQKKIHSRAVMAVVGWAIFISSLSLLGIFSDFSTFPPKIGIVLIIPLVTLLMVTFSGTLRKILPHIPIATLIRLQAFRIAVEVLLWLLFIQNLLPIQMSFEGRNYDLLTGLTAPLVAYLIARKNNRAFLLFWNLVGLGLLINIVGIALLSLPTPYRVFMNEPSNAIVAVFPFVWLPGLLVPLAYGLHFFTLRKIAIENNQPT